MALHVHGHELRLASAACAWLAVSMMASLASARFIVEKNNIKPSRCCPHAAALTERPPRGRDRQLRHPGVWRHAKRRGAVPGGPEAGHGLPAVQRQEVQVAIGLPRSPPRGPRGLLLRAQDMERAARQRSGRPGGRQRRRAAADDGQPQG
jgi:hypothetical protein